jgi:glycosyltransferase involved in cell wall biosynthesis
LGQYVLEALKSIPERPDVEVVVVDDGSTDPATREVIAGLDRTRFVVIEQTNLGLAKARNNGIRQSTGTYILPMDADNRLRSTMVEQAIMVLDGDASIGVVYGDAEYFGERTGRWEVGPYDIKRLLRSNYIDACACFRRSCWERAGGYDEHMPHMGWEDWDLWLRLSALGVQFRYIPEVFFDYRVREGSMIQDTRTKKAELETYIFNKQSLRFLAPLRSHLLASRPASELYSGRQLLGMLMDRVLGRVRNKDH